MNNFGLNSPITNNGDIGEKILSHCEKMKMVLHILKFALGEWRDMFL